MNSPSAVDPVSSPATLQRAGTELRFVMAGDRRTPDPALLRILECAHVIRNRLSIEDGLTIDEVAVQEKLTRSYVTRLLRLTVLAPGILTGILNGAQPPALTAARLMVDTRLRLDWHEQRSKLGLDAQATLSVNQRTARDERALFVEHDFRR